MGAASMEVKAFRKEGHIQRRGPNMSAVFGEMDSQFENPEDSKLEDETDADASPRELADRLAEKLAKKSSQVEQKSDEDRPIFSK